MVLREVSGSERQIKDTISPEYAFMHGCQCPIGEILLNDQRIPLRAGAVRDYWKDCYFGILAA